MKKSIIGVFGAVLFVFMLLGVTVVKAADMQPPIDSTSTVLVADMQPPIDSTTTTV